MSKSERRKLANRLCSDLAEFGGVLARRSVSPIGSRSLFYAPSQTTSGGDSLRVTVPNLDLLINPKTKHLPSSLQLEDRLYVDIIFELDLGAAVSGRIVDGVIENSVNYTIKGFTAKKSPGAEVVTAWHFDLHQFSAGPTDSCHPRFHWQFGGRELKAFTKQISGILVTEPPRLFSPPLDPILAIDFLLSQFNGPAWNSLKREERSYLQIVRNSQELFWKPYVDTLGNHLSEAASGKNLPDLDLLPNLV